MLRKWFEPSWLFDRLFSHTIGQLPYYQNYAPDINLIGRSDGLVKQYIREHVDTLRAERRTAQFLDIGARNGARSEYATGCDYAGIDVFPQHDGIIVADICKCPEISGDSFDIVFSFDVFEHVEQPWSAAEECIRLARQGGLIICRTLFSYRYHPEPNDFWRFSSQGLEQLFIRDGRTQTLEAGYDVRERRRNRKGETLAQRPPLDWMGGWRENWQVLWIGQKL